MIKIWISVFLGREKPTLICHHTFRRKFTTYTVLLVHLLLCSVPTKNTPPSSIMWDFSQQLHTVFPRRTTGFTLCATCSETGGKGPESKEKLDFPNENRKRYARSHTSSTHSLICCRVYFQFNKHFSSNCFPPLARQQQLHG